MCRESQVNRNDRPVRGKVYPNQMTQDLVYCALVEKIPEERTPYRLVICASDEWSLQTPLANSAQARDP